jgi:hypothetical protein
LRRNKKPEVISPAGYWPRLNAAIEAGAAEHFTARAKLGVRSRRTPAVMHTLHRTEEDEAAQLDLAHEGSAVESAGLRFTSFPIPDRGAENASRRAAAPTRLHWRINGEVDTLKQRDSILYRS